MSKPINFFITLWFFTSLVDVSSLLYNWFLKKDHRGTSLAVQWLCMTLPFAAGGMGLIPGGRTKIPHAMWCGPPKKNRVMKSSRSVLLFLKNTVIKWGFISVNPFHIIKVMVLFTKTNGKMQIIHLQIYVKPCSTNISFINHSLESFCLYGLYWLRPLKMEVREMWAANKCLFCCISPW